MTVPQEGQIPVQRASMRWSSRRTIGRNQRCPEVFFEVERLQSQETEGEHGQSDMVMPSLPGTSFVVVQTQLILELLIALLNPPSYLGQTHQADETRSLGKVGEPEFGGHRLLFRPFRQQPERL